MRWSLRDTARLVSLGLLLGASIARAQVPEPPTDPDTAEQESREDVPVEPAPPPRFDPTPITTQLERSDTLLRETRTLLEETTSQLSRHSQIEALEAEIEATERATRRRLDSPSASLELRDAAASWQRLGDRVARRQAEVQRILDPLQLKSEELATHATLWEGTLATLDPHTSADLSDRAAARSQAIATAQEEVSAHVTEWVALAVRLASLNATATTLSSAVDRTVRDRLWSMEAPPIWELVAGSDSERRLRSTAADAASSRALGLVDYLSADADRLWAHVIFTLLLLGGVLRIARAPSSQRPDDEGARSEVILTRPFSSALVLSLGIGGWLHAAAPSAFWTCLLAAVTLPLGRVLSKLVSPTTARGILVLLSVYFLDRFASLLTGPTLAYRLTLLTMLTLGILGVLAAARRLHPDNLPPAERSVAALRPLFQAAAGLLFLTLVTASVGMLSLSSLIFEATLESFLLLVVLGLSERLLEGVLRLVMHLPAVRSLRMVERHAHTIVARGRRLLRVVFGVLWLAGTLYLFSLFGPVKDVLGRVLSASASAGTITLSLGAVLVFVLVVLGTLWLSKALAFVLNEDVLPRMALPRGVPVTVSKTAQYFVISIGFLFALAAAGVEITQFAFLAGALGVGIGFGLQTIVNNFVSGLILLFERPIKEGDVIEIGPLLGTVKHIGIRACHVRTLDGAEVIVPNAHLVSNDVINWTLTDRMRRLDLPVGVAYGTDPQKVLTVLRACLDEQKELESHPQPQVLFMGFGDSSLDFRLRGWTTFDDQFRVRSELAVRVNNALKEAGIEIPFPQRDLHLRSIDERAARALHRSNPPDPVPTAET